MRYLYLEVIVILGLCEALLKLPEFRELIDRLDKQMPTTAFGGLNSIHKSHFAGAIRRLTGRGVLLIAADEQEAKRLADDAAVIAGEECPVLPSREFMFHNVETASHEWEAARLEMFDALANGHLGFLASTPEALLERTIPMDVLRGTSYNLTVGKQYDINDIKLHLIRGGYTLCERVEGCGQYAMRGGILDVFSPGSKYPIRVDFFDDEIDTMGYFDTMTQRRIENVNTFNILPSRETLAECCEGGSKGLASKIEDIIKSLSRKRKLPEGLLDTLRQDTEKVRQRGSFDAVDRYLALIYNEKSCALDYLRDDFIILCVDSLRIKERIKSYEWQMSEDIKTLLENGIMASEQTDLFCDNHEYLSKLEAHSTVLLETFVGAGIEPRPKAILTTMAKQLPSYGGSYDTAVQDARHYANENYTEIVLASGERKAVHLDEKLRQSGIKSAIDYNLNALPDKPIAIVTLGSLSAGMEYPTAKIAVITEGQLYAPTAKKKPKKKKSNRETINSYSDLSIGDLVVHEHHGIGRFSGIEKIKSDGVERDYIKLTYSGTDVLFVPATQLELVSKYVGAGEDVPVKLNKLGGSDWQKAKSKAKGAAKDMAKKLIALYAERKRRPGFAFPKDDDWQREFEDSFEYEETDDQLRCIKEIKADMMTTMPMDRLLCGDVGFGKTEVAFRAVMKCILGGKQAALLCPTTVLARQHYLTALRRFGNAPIKIAILSRFQNASETAEIHRKLANGSIDFIIGTHRLLNKDIEYSNLGLVIIDEEQRFGVTHKEKLKEMSKNVDALTMTATPIPRTLSMALSGVRDMSMLEEAPRDRQPVQTYVLEHDYGVIGDAIRRELARGGQVYYLHNRVESITRAAARLQEMLPDASIAVAHGKMSEEELSEVMRSMSDGEVQILVCTTIIETGIDIPNVNTLIIEDADKLGLAQLHQIRGRVGRSSRHAYAYLTYKRGKVLSEVSAKRLNAMREFAGFGAGFKIAMRDLEIRGAGNILGSEQSGHMVSVGYDMYLKLLEEAVLEERGEKIIPRDCTVELTVSAFIPETYIRTNEERMDTYRRIAFIKNKEDSEDVIDELCDRYGEPTKEVMNLIEIALLRRAASACDISGITQHDNMLKFTFHVTDFEKISKLCGSEQFKGRVLLNAGEKPYVSIRLKQGEKPLKLSSDLMKAYKS